MLGFANTFVNVCVPPPLVIETEVLVISGGAVVIVWPSDVKVSETVFGRVEWPI